MLSLDYNGSNSLLLVNAVKMYQYKAKDSEIKPYFTIDKKEKRVKRNCRSFCCLL